MHREKSDELLINGAKILELPLSAGQLNKFLFFLAELKKWSRVHNLTSLRTDRDIVVKHFLDSLLFLRAVPASAKSLADVGSGAGFPGIPIKIMRPDLEVFLIEPTKKKAVFLRHICHLLGLQGISVIDERIEAIRDLRVDVAVTRARFSVKDFLEKAGGMLAPEGVLILNKGPEADKEMVNFEGYRITVQRITLPVEHSQRRIVKVTRQ